MVHLAGEIVHATVDLQEGPEVVARRMNFIAAAAAGVGRSTSFRKHLSALLCGKNIEAECWLSCTTASLFGLPTDDVVAHAKQRLPGDLELVPERTDVVVWLPRDAADTVWSANVVTGLDIDGLHSDLPFDRAFATGVPNWRRKSCMAAEAAGVGSAS